MKQHKIALTPGQAEELTGVSTTQQRDWRRRGFLQGNEDTSHNSFDEYGLSRLFLLGLFSRAGRLADGAKAATELTPLLAKRIRDLIDENTSGDEPNACAVLWANGDIQTYFDMQTAFDSATEEQQLGPVTVLSLKTLAVPFGIRLRNLMGV
jgi:hypothetical protein